jgi:peptidoglycan hydrolase-like protein with peptidoglycan-binding domain
MSEYLTAQTQRITRPTFTPIASGVLQRQCACGQHTSVGGECEECKKKREGTLQRAAVNTSPTSAVPPIVHDVLRSSGQPLDAATRAFMEPRFGHDFSQVQVHTDAKAAESARAVNARAYTVGEKVVFGAGQFMPTAYIGQRLLAHELTHVMQQSHNQTALQHSSLAISKPDDVSEREADRIADVVMGSSALASLQTDSGKSGGSVMLQRTIGDGHDLQSARFAGDPVLEACFDNERLLQFGSRGPAVEKLQQALIDAGFPLPVFGVDGIFESETRTAVRDFQRARGLSPDGIVGPITMGSLDAQFAGGSPAPRPAPAPPGPAPAPPGPAPAPPGPAPAPPGPAPAPPGPTLPVLKFWINAFIPDTLNGAFRAPAGPFAGRQVFPGPPLPFHFNSCFETDERSFTSTLPASSRLRVDAEFDTASRALTSRSGVSGGLTFEIDCTSGAVKCSRPVSPSGEVRLIPPFLSSGAFDILLNATASDPCVTGALNIAIRGDVNVNIPARTFSFNIFTTLFPALEMYMQVGGGAPRTLFTHPPATSSPFTLAVPGVRPDSGSGTF